MPDAVGLVKTIKKTAVEAVEATKPVAVCFGKVESISPLKINVEQKMTLSKAQLVLTETAQDGLAAGDEVILLRQQGGQKYIVLDRIGGAT